MSVVANYIGSVQKPVYSASLSGVASTVYTVPASNKSLTLASFSFANSGGSSEQCELYHYDGTTAWLVWIGNITNHSTEIVTDTPVRLRPGDEIRAVGDTGVTLKLNLISQLETQTG
jgi:hypothetical protein